MIERSYNRELMLRATECVRDMVTPEKLEIWWSNPRNLMFADGENVGLASAEYPGLYTVHWYFKDRGRAAINLAKEMITNLFVNYDAKAVRGLIKRDLKASRWATRQVGLKSYGFVTYPDGDENELFYITKEEFLKGSNE